MKTLKILWLLSPVLCVLASSCTKESNIKNPLAAKPPVPSFRSSATVMPSVSKTPALVDPSLLDKNVSFYSVKTVPLNTGMGITVGSLTIKRGLDGYVYFNYSLSGGWQFSKVSLYAGPFGQKPGIEGNLTGISYPFNTNFVAPFTTTNYRFVVQNLPADSLAVTSCVEIVYNYKGKAIYQDLARAEAEKNRVDASKAENEMKANQGTKGPEILFLYAR